MKGLLFIFFLSFSKFVSGQSENNNWFFGYGAGLDFSSGTPVAILNSPIHQHEGVAAISDVAGNLLFYTDGVTVWNRSHLVMPNGFGLVGGVSSTHSATIAFVPESINTYYVFTCPQRGSLPAYDDFCYSTVDMSLNGGYGDVVIKNAPLFDHSSEKCVIIERDSVSYWVIAHDNMHTFYSFLIDAIGIHPAVTSQSFVQPFELGYMKANPQGDKIAVAVNTTQPDTFCLYSFDCISGVVSNEMKFSLNSPPTQVYGLEFSPSGRYLYIFGYGASSGGNGAPVFQYDVSVFNQSSINTSRSLVGYETQHDQGGAQLGPDNKIYISRQWGDSLGCINFPDSPAASCGYISAAIGLGGAYSVIGLPPKIHASRCGSINLNTDLSATLEHEIVSIGYSENRLFILFEHKVFDKLEINIYSIEGKHLFRKNFSELKSEQIDLPLELSKGNYILNISNSNLVRNMKFTVN